MKHFYLKPWHDAKTLARIAIHKAHRWRPTRYHMGLAALMVGGTTAGLLFAVAGLVLRLMLGPISLGPFASMIEDTLNASVTGLVVHFDRAELEWSQSEGRVDLTILGAKIFDRAGHIIAQAPKAKLDFDAGALLAGRTDLKRFALIGMQLTAVRTKAGAIRLGFRSQEGESDLLKAISDALHYDNHTLSAWGKARSKLDRFAILNARIAFHDELSGLFLVSPNASLTIADKGELLEASLSAALDVSGVRATIVAEAELLDNGIPRHGALEVHGLSLTALAANSPAFSGLAPFGLTLDLTSNVDLQPDGTIRALDFGVSGSGVAGRPKIDPVVIGIRNFRMLGRFDGVTKRLVLDELSIDGDALKAKGSGHLDVGWAEGTLKSLTGELSIEDCAVNIPSHFTAPVKFDRVALHGSYDRAAGKISVDSAVLSAGLLQGNLSGLVTLEGEQSPAMEFQGEMNAIPVRDFLRYWPAGLAEGARSWIDTNISQGHLGQAVLTAHIPAGAFDQEVMPEDALSFSFPFTNVTAQYIKGMTRLTGVDGHGHLSGDTFRAEINRAAAGPLVVSRGVVVIPNLHIAGAPGIITAHVDGKVPDVLTLIDEQPLGYPTRFHISPKETSGTAALDLNFTVPMLKDLSVDQVGIGIQVKTTGMSMPLDAKRQIDDGNLAFAIDSKSLVAQGPVRLSGVPLEFKWVEDFKATGSITTHVDVQGIMSDEGRAKLGLPDAGLVFGPSRVSLSLVGHRAQFSSAALRADLKDAEISVPTINLQKPAGQPAMLTGMLRFGANGAIAVDNFALTGNSIDIHGNFSVDDKGGLTSASLPVVRVGTGDDFSITVKSPAGGGLQVFVQGKSYDASRIFASKPRPQSKPTKAALQVLAQEEAALKDPLSLDAKLDHVLLNGGVVLTSFAMKTAFGANAHLDNFALDAAMPGKDSLTGKLTTQSDGAREVTVEATDAGTIVRALTAFPSMRKGTAAVNVTLAAPTELTSTDPMPDYHGTLVMRDFSLVDQPFFMRLFSAGSLLGPLKLLQGSGISFDKLEAPFKARGKVLTITEGRGSGSAVGVSFRGIIDRRSNTVDLGGTLVPIYGLNSVFGAVPLLGNILVSKQGEGIFGLTYSIRGDIDQPSLSVNPLSVLTPGIFRRIFERPMPTAQLAPSAPVASANGTSLTDATTDGPGTASDASASPTVPVPKLKPEAAVTP